jgi:putative spermidine/putrescine transport system substrate-binding protein
LAAIEKAALAEGELRVMALDRSWCNYGDVIDNFKAKYGLTVVELNPGASSGDEIAAIKANDDTSPDVIDVGYAFGLQLVQEKITQPYKVSTWDSIPNNVKDPEGYWYGDYYGVMSFEVNTSVIANPPQDWPDLLKPEYKDAVALAGDPRSSSQAFMGVYAATLSQGGSYDNMAPGLAFFKQLYELGNFVPVIAKNETVASGQTPIVLRWDYNALANKEHLKGAPEIQVVVPKTGVLGGVYIQGINANATHPNAAKLWMEYLYSDEGQLLWLKGLCHPIRYNDLADHNAIPADLAARLPPPEAYTTAIFPTIDQINIAKKYISENWLTDVGVEVK